MLTSLLCGYKAHVKNYLHIAKFEWLLNYLLRKEMSFRKWKERMILNVAVISTSDILEISCKVMFLQFHESRHGLQPLELVTQKDLL